MTEDINAGWKRGDPIGYMREEAPDFDVAPYEGERYEAMVPDTLDLQERAALAVNVLTESTDPEADYEMYWLCHLGRNPIIMQHDFSDHCQCKFMEALPLMRVISGSSQNEQVDRRWMEVLLRQQDEDGLLYTPIKGRPWAALNGEYYMGGKPEFEQYIDPFHNARVLTAMMLYHRRDGGTLWAERARKVVDGLVDLAVDKGDYAYYSPTCMRAVKGETDDIGKTKRMVGAHVGFMALGLVHVYREIGYEPALTLAGKLLHYLRYVLKYPDEEGRFEPGPMTHFHMHTYILLSYVEYARETGDEDLLEHARKGYEYAKANGNTLMGYFPEFLFSEELENSELCEVADMIAVGLKLTDAGVGDYLDDVDRWVRNMFAEGQLTPAKADLLRINSERKEMLAPAHDDTLKSVPGYNPMCHTTERALERNIGAFAGWPTANDWYGEVWEGIMHCCTGNATRAIYFIWEHILTFDSGKLNVNLLLNRASPWADIDSHIPYTGRVDIRIKQDAELAVRIPEWVAPEEARVTVNGEERSVSFDGRYAAVGSVKAGDAVCMTFPIHVVTRKVNIEKDTYRLVCKGNEIVAISPPGKICPMFHRPHYREDTTRWRTIERFVSNEIFSW